MVCVYIRHSLRKKCILIKIHKKKSKLTLNLTFQREHNETLAKLNFVLALVDCILELARSRAAPITALRQNAAMRDSVSGKGNIL